MINRKDLVITVLIGLFFVAILYPGITASESEWNLWCDVNDDGIVEARDLYAVARAYGATGEPLTKAALTYDSGWVDITDKAGEYFNITHNLNSTDVMVDITGKTKINSGVHQRNLGGIWYTPEWSKTYGGTNYDVAWSVVQTADRGYAIAGYTVSFGAGGYDFWLVKTDETGHQQWNKTYGGTSADEAYSVIQTSDGGYTIAGRTQSFGAGGYDFWLVKTNSIGHQQWNKTYGGTDSDYCESVIQTSDGGYAIAGYTASFGVGDHDFWLVKTCVESGLVWTDSTADTITLYRGATDAYWNHVRVRIWKIKETP